MLKVYPCRHCEYAATSASNLKIHIKGKYEGVRYPCKHCDYAATTAGALKRHVESQHELEWDIHVYTVNILPLQQVI